MQKRIPYSNEQNLIWDPNTYGNSKVSLSASE